MYGRLKENRSTYFSALFILYGIALGCHRFLLIALGNSELSLDAREWWFPLTEAVFSGVPLYLDNAADNKPPLFEYLNLLVATTGQYKLVFLLLMGFITGIIAVLLQKWMTTHWNEPIGILTGILYLSSIPIINGVFINVRQWGIAALLVALVVRSPIWKGVAVAVGGLFTQFVVFAIPAVVLDIFLGINTADWKRWFSTFTIAGMVTVGIIYGSVAVIWGVESMMSGIFLTIAIGPLYVVGTETELGALTVGGVTQSPFGDPLFYIKQMTNVVIRIPHILFPGLVFFFLYPPSTDVKTWSRESQLLLLAILLSIPLLVRGFPSYWLYPMPFFSGMASITFSKMFQ